VSLDSFVAAEGEYQEPW